jgi:tetratricopeptide (TPR) repeat protein
MPTPNTLDSSPLERQLAEAQDRAEKGEYEAAVRAVREAKSLAPKNVYVLAFEKQAEQLNELHAAGSLTEEQRTDILESIPSIIERAVESSRSPGTLTDMSALKSGAGAAQDKKEKAAALEWLKNQYFQHAHEYIRKGEYQNALAEIRRVYIIDPSNAIASDFEKQFEALAQLKRVETLRVYPSAPAQGKGIAAGDATGPPPPGSSPATEPTPVLTEEWSSPREMKREAAHRAQEQAKPKGSKKASTLLIALILLALCVLGALLYIYYQRNVYKKAAVTSLPPPSSEQFFGAPAETAEQNFLVSDSESSSGTPEVTALAVNESPPAAEVAKKKTPGPSKGAARRENKTPSPAAPAPGPQKPANSPPVMAAQSQPDLKPPATPPRTEDTATPAPFVAVEKPARVIRLEKPKISSEGFLAGVEGQIVVQVRIDPTGKPVQTVTLKSTNDLLIQPVTDAVMASQYAPAEMTTGPVASWLTIPFRFAKK